MVEATGLERAAVAAGEAWAAAVVVGLRGQDRAVTGGWPGTMREARARVQMVAVGRGDTLSVEEFDAASRRTYAVARSAWAQVAEPESEGDA